MPEGLGVRRPCALVGGVWRPQVPGNDRDDRCRRITRGTTSAIRHERASRQLRTVGCVPHSLGPVKLRESVRAVILDENESVLLVRFDWDGLDTPGGFWANPGGCGEGREPCRRSCAGAAGGGWASDYRSWAGDLDEDCALPDDALGWSSRPRSPDPSRALLAAAAARRGRTAGRERARDPLVDPGRTHQQ